MRFTIWPDPHRRWVEVVAVAHQAQVTGWHAIRFGDDIGHAVAAGRQPSLECWATMGAIAAQVPRLRLEAIVCGHCQRHPAVVTKQAVTADHLSDGRIVLGLVAGGDEQGREVLEEACQVVHSLVSSDRATFHGRHYQLNGAPLDPKPRQVPLPLLTWGDGSPASARLAARFAHHWSITGSPSQVKEQMGQLRQACHALGRDRAEITVSASAGLPATVDASIAALREYAGAGVDEWVVPDVSLGPDHRQRLAGLARIMAVVAPALS